MEEIWKDVAGYEGIYHISNVGNIKRVASGKILKKRKNACGYWHVGLSNKGEQKTFAVHVLLGRAFIPNPENKLQINHIDGNKLNNSLSNLEWVTAQENIQHALKNGLRKTRKISQYDLNGDLIKTYETISEAGKIFRSISNRPDANISCAVRNKSSTAFGYIWRYAD